MTLESGVTYRAKQWARERGRSLSGVVEELLAREIGLLEESAKKPSFSERWKGGAQLTDRSDPRTRQLKEKYGLAEKP